MLKKSPPLPSPASMSDAALDNELERAFVAKDFARYGICASEIASRLTSVYSFATGVFGATRFPNYEKHAGGFTQSGAAQDSLKNSATNLADKAGTLVSTGFNSALIALAMLGVVVYLVKMK